MKAQNPDFKELAYENAAKHGLIRHLGIEVDDLGEGWVQTSIRPDSRHTQQDGFVHAGVLSTMGDFTGGLAAYTLVAPNERVLTIEFKINLLRPALGERIICLAKVLRQGRTITVSESELFSLFEDRKKMVAKTSVTIAVIHMDTEVFDGSAG
ncbi:MAG: PaaI family thioesterase [Thermodesulfobacteriota bacterium]|nr:PaaI family thioesterase [Thermodesulfobacteriota bacterium]